jgi:quinol monooxygenase YgiN
MELTIEMRARPGKVQELYQTLQALLPTIRSEKGSRDCRVYQDVEDENVFFLVIDWEKKSRLEHYMQTGSGSALIGAIDLLSLVARVRFGKNLPWEGIDSLKRMREG